MFWEALCSDISITIWLNKHRRIKGGRHYIEGSIASDSLPHLKFYLKGHKWEEVSPCFQVNYVHPGSPMHAWLCKKYKGYTEMYESRKKGMDVTQCSLFCNDFDGEGMNEMFHTISQYQPLSTNITWNWNIDEVD